MSIKITRAKKFAALGDCPSSFCAMMEAIPDTVLAALTSRQIADLVDANWQLASASKAIASRTAITEGGIWDASQQAFIALRAAP